MNPARDSIRQMVLRADRGEPTEATPVWGGLKVAARCNPTRLVLTLESGEHPSHYDAQLVWLYTDWHGTRFTPDIAPGGAKALALQQQPLVTGSSFRPGSSRWPR